MFQLLVSGSGWKDSHDSMYAGRVFEYTDESLAKGHKSGTELYVTALARIPAVFMSEISGAEDPLVRVGYISRANLVGRDYALDYQFDSSIEPIANTEFKALSRELGIESFEFERTHWAIKDADLFKVLYRNRPPKRRQPKVFSLSSPEAVDESLVSVMMPFNAAFTGVWNALREAIEALGLRCNRADDIWNHDSVVQDIVSLIDRSKIVVCDCTGRNANVFYEAGIAHAIGRTVIFITQAESDIPFDLRHLRFVQYLNNNEGLTALKTALTPRIQHLASDG